jgi:purine nucleosidase
MHGRVPVLFDTDIGTDIDDALCLVYLLRQPRCELLGVTTVTGEPERRAMLVDAICRAEGREGVPIHSGSPEPLLVDQRQPVAQQGEALRHWPHRESYQPASAVEFLRTTIRARPGEITLVAVGPMTNLGLLFTLDPAIPSLLRGLVLMAGVFTTRTPDGGRIEHNARVDPHATAIVYRRPVAMHRSVGLDVTMRCVLDAATCRERLRGGGLDVVAEMAEVWFRQNDRIRFHDPLAGAAVFEDVFLEWERGDVAVELLGQRVAGMTHWVARSAGSHQVAIGVDPERFFTHYFGVLGR